MPRLENLSSVLGSSALSGRWIKSPGGSLKASWASSSVSFLFSGSKLSLYAGPGTQRQESNGGTPMIAIIVGPSKEATLKNPAYWRTVDPEANSEVLILDNITHPEPQKKTFVQIMLIDWASTFELGALVYDDVSGYDLHYPMPIVDDSRKG